MKKLSNKILLILFIISFIINIFFMLTIFNIVEINVPLWFSKIYANMVIYFPALPAFLLQQLLCRTTKRWWIRIMPSFIVAAAGLVTYIKFLTERGWDQIGWLALLVICVSMAIGCVISWAVYGIYSLISRKLHK